VIEYNGTIHLKGITVLLRRSFRFVFALAFGLFLVTLPGRAGECIGEEGCSLIGDPVDYSSGEGETDQDSSRTPSIVIIEEDSCPSAFEYQVVILINAEREKKGVPSLKVDVRLQEAARRHSNDMATNGAVPPYHEGSDGSTPTSRVTDAGYDWQAIGETIWLGSGPVPPEPDEIVKAWMGSEGHRDILLGSQYEHIGVGFASGSGSGWDYFVTADFAATEDPRQAPPIICDPAFYHYYFPFISK
jgi:uncharacterized protein YkwD